MLSLYNYWIHLLKGKKLNLLYVAKILAYFSNKLVGCLLNCWFFVHLAWIKDS